MLTSDFCLFFITGIPENFVVSLNISLPLLGLSVSPLGSLPFLGLLVSLRDSHPFLGLLVSPLDSLPSLGLLVSLLDSLPFLGLLVSLPAILLFLGLCPGFGSLDFPGLLVRYSEREEPRFIRTGRFMCFKLTGFNCNLLLWVFI